MNHVGSFGEVFRGIWRGTEVAIKVMLEQDLIVENMQDFCNEISLLRLALQVHKNDRSYILILFDSYNVLYKYSCCLVTRIMPITRTEECFIVSWCVSLAAG
jgi:serine/threonine protein kinase